MEWSSSAKDFSLSAAGTFCATGRYGTVNLVDLENKTHFELKSDKMVCSFSPCFINGQAHFLAVGGGIGEGVEIWDIKKQTATRVLKVDNQAATSVASTNDILAAGSRSK